MAQWLRQLTTLVNLGSISCWYLHESPAGGRKDIQPKLLLYASKSPPSLKGMSEPLNKGLKDVKFKRC